jgi:hypothetical protein
MEGTGETDPSIALSRNCWLVLFEPQPAQPRRYVRAVILGSEERQPIINEDIPLPFVVPAAALK